LLIYQHQLTDPVGALISLKERIYDHDRFTLEEYIDHLARTLWKFHSLGINIQGETLEEKCESCLNQLVSHGMITLIH
jgi:hypothetical protein